MTEENKPAQNPENAVHTGEGTADSSNFQPTIDALSNMSQDMVTLELSDGNSSALFTIPDNTTFKYVVMPMRI